MKSLLLIGALALSLTANVWLLSPRETLFAGPTTASANLASAKTNPSSQNTPAPVPTQAVTWTSLRNGDDLPALVAGLRAAGFPPDLIRRIVVAQLNEHFAARRKQISDNSTMPFWKHSAPSAEQSSALRAINDEIRTTLLSLGIEPDSPETKANRLQRYGNIPQGKLVALEKILLDYSDLSNQLYSANSPAQGPELGNQRNLLEAEQRKELLALLTPAELEEYDLRNSQASFQVRHAVRAMNMSEDEYRRLFRIVQTREQSHPTVTGVQTAEMIETQATASSEMRNQIRATLGDQRFLQYLAAQNSESTDVARFAANNPGMSVDQIVGLLNAQGALSSAMTRATRQSNLTLEERRSAGAKVAAEYRAKLAEQIGADRLNALRKGNYGQLSMLLKLDVPPPKN